MADQVEEGVRQELISLACPVTLKRQLQPCRTSACSPHARTFCATSVEYLRAGPSGRPRCPICSEPFDPATQLAVDGKLAIFLTEHPDHDVAAVRRRPGGMFEYGKPHRLGNKQAKPRARERTQLAQPATVPPLAAHSAPRLPSAAEISERSRKNMEGVVLCQRFVPARGDCGPRPGPAQDAAMGSERAGPRPEEASQHPPGAASGEHVAAFYAALTQQPSAAREDASACAGWWCEPCALLVRAERSEHERSIAHRFALTRAQPPRPAPLGIPEGNVGYRMLRDALGWEEGAGLGRHSQGSTRPVPTRLKRDREGLRVMSKQRDAMQPLRVTHSAAEVMGAEARARPRSKAERRLQRRVARKREAYLMRCKELLIQRQLHEDSPYDGGSNALPPP